MRVAPVGAIRPEAAGSRQPFRRALDADRASGSVHRNRILRNRRSSLPILQAAAGQRVRISRRRI